jgi:FdhD protein
MATSGSSSRSDLTVADSVQPKCLQLIRKTPRMGGNMAQRLMTRRADTSSHAIRPVDVVRSGGGGWSSDHVAVESPLEVRVNGHPFSVIMRTPGADRELTVGFLFTEGLVRHYADVERVDVDEPSGVANVIFVRGRADAVAEALGQRRQVAMNSSCGLCGRRSLESLEINAPPLAMEWSVEAAVIDGLPATLRSAQSAFAHTGGLHAAGLFDLQGRLEVSAEDVGRHNAVDKLLGHMLETGRVPLGRSLLLVSGRSSFEIVQKSWLGGLPLVSAVSAPSSLAVDLARQAGMTLLGFVRDGRFNVYAHPDRVAPIGGRW